MEAYGEFPEGDQWDSCSQMFSSSHEEDDHQLYSILPMNPIINPDGFYSLDSNYTSDFPFLRQESCYDDSNNFAALADHNISMFLDVDMISYKSIGSFNVNPEPYEGDQLNARADPKKIKTRAPRHNIQKESKKRRKVFPKGNVEEEEVEECNKSNGSVVTGEGPSSNSYSSEDENNAPQEMCNKGKNARASRGSATDPQSLYARKRREKINERLRILQKLVPNGTKVDISTMLEDAVQYVKFLQLQIKLLSSEDLWMYAQFAYNGMDINDLPHRIAPLL